MGELRENVDLQNYNTFHIRSKARYFIDIESEGDLQKIPRGIRACDTLILGGGSNVLFCGDFPGLILHPRMKGISLLEENRETVKIRAMAGENWDGLVSFTVSKGWGGLENLSLIPGNVGAAPIQNIGAYGAEVKDCLEEVETLDLETGERRVFDREKCRLGYRDSIFKHEWKNRLMVVSVVFSLWKQPVFKTGYALVEEELSRLGGVSLANLRKAIVSIRERKLPDPAVTGNAGSFFKNPLVSSTRFSELRKDFPGMPGYVQPDGSAKVPAAWLIEQCNWKGFRRGDAGVHQHQPLVLVNHGEATGVEMLALSREIMDSVENKFGIPLEREVTVAADPSLSRGKEG